MKNNFISINFLIKFNFIINIININKKCYIILVFSKTFTKKNSVK